MPASNQNIYEALREDNVNELKILIPIQDISNEYNFTDLEGLSFSHSQIFNNEHRTLPFCAIQFGAYKIFKWLLDNKAELSKEDYNKIIHLNQTNMFFYALKSGVKMNDVDDYALSMSIAAENIPVSIVLFDKMIQKGGSNKVPAIYKNFANINQVHLDKFNLIKQSPDNLDKFYKKIVEEFKTLEIKQNSEDYDCRNIFIKVIDEEFSILMNNYINSIFKLARDPSKRELKKLFRDTLVKYLNNKDTEAIIKEAAHYNNAHFIKMEIKDAQNLCRGHSR